MKIRLISALVALAALCSCVKHYGEDVDQSAIGTYRGNVVSCVKGGTVTVTQIMEWLGDDAKIDSLDFKGKLTHDVDFYHVTYYTQYGLEGSRIRERKIVKARTLVLVPHRVAEEDQRLAVYFHGTVMPVPEITTLFDMGTPSDFDGTNPCKDLTSCGLPLAASGYHVVIPEYTGFGPTANLDHPFVYYKELWLSCFDGIKAGRTVLVDPSYGIKAKVSKDLYLCGWSQGGGMALYAQKMLETDPHYNMTGFHVKATTTLAGPFNMTRFLGDMMDNPHKIYLLMPLYGWAGYSINMFAPELQRPMDQIFRPSIYDQIDAFILLGNTPADLFQEFFMSHMKDGTDPVFAQVLEDISTYHDWAPVAPVFIHHGTKDTFVPFFNSEDAYNGLKDSAVGGVEFFPYVGLDHGNFVPTYISKTIEEFNSVL